LCTIRKFTRDDAPHEVNGRAVTHVAHVSDFYRMNVCFSSVPTLKIGLSLDNALEWFAGPLRRRWNIL
jgi:hypothetical protein